MRLFDGCDPDFDEYPEIPKKRCPECGLRGGYHVWRCPETPYEDEGEDEFQSGVLRMATQCVEEETGSVGGAALETFGRVA